MYTCPEGKRKTRVVIFNTTKSQFELLAFVAEQEEVSMSEFLRQALNEKAGRVLAGTDSGHEPVEAGS